MKTPQHFIKHYKTLSNIIKHYIHIVVNREYYVWKYNHIFDKYSLMLGNTIICCIDLDRSLSIHTYIVSNLTNHWKYKHILHPVVWTIVNTNMYCIQLAEPLQIQAFIASSLPNHCEYKDLLLPSWSIIADTSIYFIQLAEPFVNTSIHCIQLARS